MLGAVRNLRGCFLLLTEQFSEHTDNSVEKDLG